MKRLKTVKLMAISDNDEIGNEDQITIFTGKRDTELFFDLKEQIQSFKKQQMDDVYCNLYISIIEEDFYKFPYDL